MAVFATFSRTPVKILRTSVDDFCRVCNVNIAISGCARFHLFEGKTSLQNNVAGRLSQVLGFEVTRENGLSSHLCLKCKRNIEKIENLSDFTKKFREKALETQKIQNELSISGAQGPRVKRGHRSSPSSSSPHAKKSSGSSFWIRPKRILKQSNDSQSLAAMPFHEELVIPVKPKTVTSSVEVKVKFPSKTIYKEVSEATDAAIIRNMVCGTSDSVVNAVWNCKELQSRVVKKVEKQI